MRIPLVLFAALFVAPDALAGATDWVEFAPDTRVRLISADERTADGKALIAVDLEMPATTKTYWRTPGETGIPAAFDLSASEGIVTAQPLWPYPMIDVTVDYTDFVYYGAVVIPLELELTGDTAVVDMALTMGICSEICVPAMTRLRLALDFSSPDPGQSLRIAQALATVPIPWPGPEEAIGEVTYDADRRLLRVPLDSSAVDPASLLAEAVDVSVAFGAPQKSPEGGIVSLSAIGKAGDGVGDEVRLTFMTVDGPYELIRRVKPSTGE